jgi:hypothetical protein
MSKENLIIMNTEKSTEIYIFLETVVTSQVFCSKTTGAKPV